MLIDIKNHLLLSSFYLLFEPLKPRFTWIAEGNCKASVLLVSQKEVVKSIGNPAGIGQGTGLGLRERDRDGIGFGHYRLRTKKEYYITCKIRFFEDF